MTALFQELIRRKRDGLQLSDTEIAEVVDLYTRSAVPDYQMSAMLMAIFFSGLNGGELSAWTGAMLGSGRSLDLSDINGIKVDKHSTGGVGDKISICLAPAVAALGVSVPMISGRGLGHTGGTLDKLESIPGFRVDLTLDEAAAQIRGLGLFLIGQTAELAPADRKLYALRDVTGTVESIPLIASSIMSKKLAEGIDGLVLDVKVGSGAFMRDIGSARELAETMIDIGRRAGVEVRALATGMDRPLGRTIGNSLEVAEAIDVMKGGGPDDVAELARELGAEMLVLGKVAASLEEGRSAMSGTLSDGGALELFRRTVAAQGGDPGVCDDPRAVLPKAGRSEAVVAKRSGFLVGVDPMKAALAALEAGAGRREMSAPVDPAAGVELLADLGSEVVAGRDLALLHHNSADPSRSIDLLNRAFEIGDSPPPETSLVIERM